MRITVSIPDTMQGCTIFSVSEIRFRLAAQQGHTNGSSVTSAANLIVSIVWSQSVGVNGNAQARSTFSYDALAVRRTARHVKQG